MCLILLAFLIWSYYMAKEQEEIYENILKEKLEQIYDAPKAQIWGGSDLAVIST